MTSRYASQAIAALAVAALGIVASDRPAAAQAPVPVQGSAHVEAAEVVPADSGRIIGRVVDAETSEPLVGVVVRVVDLGRQDLTHEDGTFHIGGIAPGRYTVSARRIGYGTEEAEVVVERGGTARVNIEMAPVAIDLGELIITAGIGERRRTESTRAVNVMSAEKLARELDGTIGAMLDNEAGISTMSMGPATARPVIRGLSGDRILILEDGDRVGDLSANSSDHAVSVDPLSAKQVEVIRGPAALMYGSNALGGVINVVREEVPRSRPDRPTGAASLQAQSVSRTGGAAVAASGGVGPFAVRAEVNGRSGGDLRTPAGILENTETQTYEAGVGASLIRTWGHAGLAGRLYRSEYGIPGGAAGGHEEGVRVEMERLATKAETEIQRRDARLPLVEVDATFTRYHHREIEASGIVGTEFGLLTAATESRARHDAAGPFDSGVFGLRFEWSDYAAGGSLDTPPGREYTIGGFVLEELELEPVRLEVGARYDWHRVEPLRGGTVLDFGEIRPRSFGSLSGSVGGLLDVAEGVSLGASVARAFRTPGLDELYSSGPHLATYSFEIGNPELDVEIGTGWDAFLRVARRDLNAEIAGFRNHIDNYIYPRNTGQLSRVQLPIYQHTNNDAVLSGFEASAEWNLLRRWVLESVASYVRGTITTTGEPLPFIPPLNGHLGLRYESPGVTAGVRWVTASKQDRVGEFEDPTDGYHVFNASASYRWTAFDRVHTLGLRLENLLDTEYRNHLSRVKNVMPEPGRSINLSYRINF